MISLVDSQSSTIDTIAFAQRLVRTVMFSSEQFSLVLACCNSGMKQKQILSMLEEFYPAEIMQMKLASDAKQLYTKIANRCTSIEPQALMVTGLESVIEINQLLISANLMRDEFAKQFNFPVILWVNDEIIRKMVRIAPDFKDWSTTFRFDAPLREQVSYLPLSA
ncbi:MAG: hypothetical protein AAF378_23265 [Cyanobacteria bacterium P01_A01_bin.84]